MKTWSRVLAALALALSMVLSTWPDIAAAQARLEDLEAKKKNPYKQVGSSFRRIPPSTSNPTQNKSNPP
ncbi:uncharacterized protein Pyn_34796 [Prunus yedoensis var. nudiflora]|uniref:Uncharacterized protein n=1 Tax=Prunus yedoensis var. nudiflora TaxID=2094558 RepID=A0A315A515_PRUYE|nr:uncharacterized protein Pyn_34796 [Prunus yedoensis var. nudiflora]